MPSLASPSTMPTVSRYKSIKRDTISLQPDFRFLLAHPAHLIALGFGSGLAPKAPGTVGTVLGLPLFWLIAATAPDLPNRIILLVAAFLLGIWACGRTDRKLSVPDHGGMVWDEIVAFALVLLFAPPGWPWIALAFTHNQQNKNLKPW